MDITTKEMQKNVNFDSSGVAILKLVAVKVRTKMIWVLTFEPMQRGNRGTIEEHFGLYLR